MKKILVAVIAVLVIGAGVAMYMFNKPHKDIAGAEADVKIGAAALFDQYSANEADANTKYLDKVISVSGTVGSINRDNAEEPSLNLNTNDMMGVVTCQFLPDHAYELDNVQEGDEITVKGQCTGMLMDVVLIRCSIEK